jgi:hypothetical protein
MEDPVPAPPLVGEVVHHRELRVAHHEELDLGGRQGGRVGRFLERPVGETDHLAVAERSEREVAGVEDDASPARTKIRTIRR